PLDIVLLDHVGRLGPAFGGPGLVDRCIAGTRRVLADRLRVDEGRHPGGLHGVEDAFGTTHIGAPGVQWPPGGLERPRQMDHRIRTAEDRREITRPDIRGHPFHARPFRGGFAPGQAGNRGHLGCGGQGVEHRGPHIAGRPRDDYTHRFSSPYRVELPAYPDPDAQHPPITANSYGTGRYHLFRHDSAAPAPENAAPTTG